MAFNFACANIYNSWGSRNAHLLAPSITVQYILCLKKFFAVKLHRVFPLMTIQYGARNIAQGELVLIFNFFLAKMIFFINNIKSCTYILLIIC